MPISTNTAIIITISMIGLSGPKIGNNGFGVGVAVADGVGVGLGVGVCKYFIVAVGLGVGAGTTSVGLSNARHATQSGLGSHGSSGSDPIIISSMLQYPSPSMSLGPLPPPPPPPLPPGVGVGVGFFKSACISDVIPAVTVTFVDQS